MTLPHNEQELGKPLRRKKKRSAVFIVIVISVLVHVLGGIGLATLKIIEVLQPEPEFEAPPVVQVKQPPPPPPPPPTIKRAQKSLPRPQALAVQNSQNVSVPTIELNQSKLSIGGGRGFGGGLGALGGGVADAIRITSFGFDRAMEGTLEGTLYDFKRDEKGKEYPIASESDFGPKTAYAAEIIQDFARRFDIKKFERKFSKSSKLLYGSYFVIPAQSANVAPKSFSAEKEIAPSLIAVVYQGTFKAQESGRFRLLGKGDDVLLVRINGKLILDASWRAHTYSQWEPSSSAERANKDGGNRYFGLSQPVIRGDWFNLTAGRETEVEILISEVPGGGFGAYLLIEDSKELKPQIFSTRPLSEQDTLFLKNTHPDAAQFIPD
ncbi:hypothetical protein QEH52_02445 [Coraliomargarita sp. SDUM461003]|uniref:PA14 domain-containing protein n=1 Tax=Thalassobacterium maritimum TaxID=3041265 RepID=A0ABU1AQA2_9BACT|nr:hypothetical protein [Coraliomargarita sp. SDUM461003]MDQ8206351.1 hypothetical protein [Coraliomargarita sp. SDUM461003]